VPCSRIDSARGQRYGEIVLLGADAATGPAAYTSMISRRDTRFGIDRGSTAYLLDDPDGSFCVLIRQPRHAAGADLRRPHRPRGPPEPATRVALPSRHARRRPGPHTRQRTAPIIQDDLGNAYDRAGGPFSNYRP